MRKGQTTTSVSEQTIKDIISRWTGIPISKISESETEKLTKLEDIIHERLINQTHAVEPVAQAIRRGRAGLKSSDRPIGSFFSLDLRVWVRRNSQRHWLKYYLDKKKR